MGGKALDDHADFHCSLQERGGIDYRRENKNQIQSVIEAHYENTHIISNPACSSPHPDSNAKIPPEPFDVLDDAHPHFDHCRILQ